MSDTITQAAKQIAIPNYFFQNESGYEEWLKQNQNTGFVANGFKDKDGTKVSEQHFRVHKLPCDNSLNKQEYEGRRTNYGKLCHLDEDIVFEDCKRRTKVKLTRCSKCYKP
ncbi:MAG: hypothetical protein OXI17_14490 [Gammaproteobacteria bacterium]|nr:hypothetical protein [Gammaproteobacteria bacterium]